MSAGDIAQPVEEKASAITAATTRSDKQKILKARAEVLARTRASRVSESDLVEVVEFLLAHEKYALEAEVVREVYPLKEFTSLPGVPPFVFGIINVRGEIVSIVDIRKFFNLPARGITELNKVIIIRNRWMEFGILADAVLGTRHVPRTAIQAPLPTLTGPPEQYLRGIAPGPIAILNGAKLLNDPRLVVQEDGED